MNNSRQFQGASIRHLILGCVELMRSRLVPVSIASAFFALLLAVGSTFADARIQSVQDDILLRAKISEDVFREKVTSWATETSDLDLIKFASDYHSRGLSLSTEPTLENAPMLFILRTWPYVLGLLFFDLVILFIAATFFLTYFSDPLLSPSDAARKLPSSICRILGLALWMMIRSFSWIPIAGPIIGCYFFPRFVLAPSLVASGDSTIRESIHVSMARTSGKWLSIVGRLIVFVLLSFALLWFVMVIAGVLSIFVVKLGFLVWLFGLLFVIAFQVAYFVVLTAITV